MGYKTFQIRPPLPSYISPWRQYNLLFRVCRTTVRWQNGSDNNYRMKLTSAWAWLRMVWTLNSYSLQKWYLLAIELATADATRVRKEQTEYPVYHPTRLLQRIQLTTRDSLQRTRFGLPSTTNPAFHLPPTNRSAAQSKYLLHFPFPNGR